MPQTITYADVRRGWIDCDTCGDTLRIFYHHRCPTCHAQFTLPDAENRADESESLSSGNGVESRRLQASQHPRFSEKPPAKQEEQSNTPAENRADETHSQVRTRTNVQV